MWRFCSRRRPRPSVICTEIARCRRPSRCTASFGAVPIWRSLASTNTTSSFASTIVMEVSVSGRKNVGQHQVFECGCRDRARRQQAGIVCHHHGCIQRVGIDQPVRALDERRPADGGDVEQVSEAELPRQDAPGNSELGRVAGLGPGTAPLDRSRACGGYRPFWRSRAPCRRRATSSS